MRFALRRHHRTDPRVWTNRWERTRVRMSSGTLAKLAISLRSSFWFMPALIVLASVALAAGMVALDRALDGAPGERWPELFASDADGARELLAIIAGSMITVAGVVFSITIAALAQAASQYTSRVLRNFMRDRGNQAVLGVFLGVFAYCLVVMHAITPETQQGFVPLVAVVGGLVLSLVAVSFLVYFIHHVAAEVQSGQVARSIALETLHTIDELLPERLEEGDAGDQAPEPDDLHWHPVAAPEIGYIEGVDLDALADFARERGVVVRMERWVGDFCTPDRPIAGIAAPDGAQLPDEEALRHLAGLFAVDSYRAIEQDVPFGIRQLVDVALVALSPANTDSTTAITALDHLSVVMQRLAGRRIVPRPIRDGDALRVIPKGPDFEHLLALAFDQILENAHGNTLVLLRLLRAIDEICPGTRDAQRLCLLEAKRESIAEVARETVFGQAACRAIEAQLAGQPVAVDMAGA